jgi:dihydropyrimidinase
MTTTLIVNANIVTAVDQYKADILIENGLVHTIGIDLPRNPGFVIHDASGFLVFPGGVDPHTHLDWDFGNARTVDTFGSGTKSAAFGGTTTVVDFSNQTRGKGLLEGLADWRRRAESACVDVSTHMIVLDVNTSVLSEMERLIKDEGVTSFKLFTAYPGVLMVDDGSLFKAMRVVGNHGGMICVHAENGPVIQVLVEEAVARGNIEPKYHAMTRPSLMEGEATHRAIRIAQLAGSPLYVVHLSASEALSSVRQARDDGLNVYAETCPHYLFLTEEEYEKPGFEGAKYVMTPPLRNCAHQQSLWQGLRTDDLQVVSTDHCPFCINEKPYGMRFSKLQGKNDFSKIPNGAPGIETRLPLLYDGAVRKNGMSLNRFVQLCSTTPAKLFGLFPRKGTIAIGSDADLVFFDPNEKWTIRAAEGHGRIDYSMFEGREVMGRIRKVFLRGQLIVDGAEWLGKEGMGQFVYRKESGRV